MTEEFTCLPRKYGDVLEHYLGKYPSARIGEPAIEKFLTFKEFQNASRFVAKCMRNELLNPKDIVHFIGSNSLSLGVCYCSIAMNEWIPVGSNSTTPKEELQSNISNTFSKGLVISKSLWEKFGRNIKSKSLKIIFIYELVNVNDFEIQITQVPVNSTNSKTLDPTENLSNVSFMFMTSGSTGTPKSIKIDHTRFMSKVCLGEFISSGPVFKKIYINCQPFSNISATILFLMSFTTGQEMLFVESFNEKNFLDVFTEYNCNYIFAPPAIIHSLSKYENLHNYDLSNLRQITCGGSKLNKESLRILKERSKITDRTIFSEGYGSSESGPNFFSVTSINNIDDGFPLKNDLIEAKIVDPQTKAETLSGEEGELWIRSSGLMLGYLNDDIKTKAALTDDGWYRSGDLGYIKKGRLHISGRIKEVIKYRSFSVHASELERVLFTHPAVKSAGVVAEPHEEHGEIPVAFVVKKSGVSSDELIRFIAERVSEYKQIRKVYFLEQMPHNSGNKIDKTRLQKYLK